MNDKVKDKEPELPWVFRDEAPGAKAFRAKYDPIPAVYRLFQNTRNPYLKRALAPPAAKLEHSPSDVQRLFRLLVGQRSYQVGPENTGDPLQRRSLEHPPPPPAAAPKFQDAGALPGDPARLPGLIDRFFQSVLERLRKNPESFFTVVDELTQLFDEHQVKVRISDAFRNLEDWNDLLDALDELSRYPAAETFDLFCSALFAYDELVEPEER